MATLRRPSDCVSLLACLEIKPEEGTELRTMFQDPRRFVLEYRDLMNKAPLQVCMMAAYLAPVSAKMHCILQAIAGR